MAHALPGPQPFPSQLGKSEPPQSLKGTNGVEVGAGVGVGVAVTVAVGVAVSVGVAIAVGVAVAPG